jgi:hypothetical protein
MRPLLYNSPMNHGCIELNWAACPQWATSASADLVDAVERVGGGWTVLLIDVQGSGSGGRRLAGALMHFARQQVAAGVDPVTAVSSVHQHLVALRQGKVGASVHVCALNGEGTHISVVGFGALEFARRESDGWSLDEFRSTPAGFADGSPPSGLTSELCPGDQVVLANDGIAHSTGELNALLGDGALPAGAILDAAIRRDGGRPRADMAVVTLQRTTTAEQQQVLTARVSIPVRPKWSDR